MKRFLWVSGASLALIVISALLPDGLWASVGGLPAHPVIVHGIVVLVPLVSLFVIVSLFIPSLLAKSHLWVIGGYGVLAAGAIGAKKSGEQLAEIVGMPEQHEQFGTILVPIVIALFVAFALLSLVAVVAPQRTLAILLAIVVGVLGGASIPLTIIVGHSGAESVWGEVLPAPSDEDEFEEELDESIRVESTPAPTPAPAPSTDSAPRVITADEVAQHSTPEDCWTIVNGEVYDLTSFVGKHPGGRSAISQICGTDGTALFTGQHGGQGAPERQLSSLKLGVLAQ